MGRRGGPVAPSQDSTRVNERIRAREVRLIGAEGEQLGVMTSDEARLVAEESGLDLVEVAANANPPVCRVMDYGKYKYEEKKKKAAGKAKSHSTSLKEVKLRPGTDDHDLDFKLKNARRFLMDGDKVKVTVMFRGREMAHRENGYRQLDRVKEMLGDLAAMENMPRMEGRFLSTIFVANRETIARVKREEAKSAQTEAADGAEQSAPETKAPDAQESDPAKPEKQQDAPEGANA
ncbi:MAG: translation initiation factor IF-3 [Myxococcales bacterium]|nr:translation initiation factor IF-3 [Myxococcales bacterium]